MTLLATGAQLEPALEQVTAELERGHVPATELAVVKDGAVLFAGAFGTGSASTLFHHGSCGKAYTGLLAAILAEDGVVDLDAPVRTYVPDLRLPDPVIADRVTLRDLLSHRSGLGRHDMAWILNPSWTSEEWVARLPHLPLVGDLRAQWSYSNFGYTLAGVALGRAAGSNWQTLAHEHVLDPLGMTRSVTSEQAARDDSDHAVPHVLRGAEPVVSDWYVFDALAAAGGVISCADDSARWLSAQLGEHEALAAAVAVSQQSQMLLPAGMAPFPEMQPSAYGLGWVVGTYRGRPLVWHNGGVHGFTTQTLLLPQQRIGVVACGSLFPTNDPLAVVLHIADALLGEAGDGPSWFERLREAPADGAEVPAQSTPGAAYAHPLPDYAGCYQHRGYGDMEVAVAGEGLSVRLGESAVTARHRHYETWDLHYEPLDLGFTATFAAGPDGALVAATVEFQPGTSVRFDRVAQASS